jgi:hypothetical protein
MAQASASTFHRLNEIMRQDENRGAAVAAARTIEGMTNEAVGGSRTLNLTGGPRAGYLIDLSDDGPSPGVVIQNVNQIDRPQSARELIDITPLRNDE